mmetsp:Transcript_86339/g.252661  ORF Transcript_86339/g.252661 Transcript_86339/m.252661 type:complete len:300 (+) Transcript_86339:962-1861(+)
MGEVRRHLQLSRALPAHHPRARGPGGLPEQPRDARPRGLHSGRGAPPARRLRRPRRGALARGGRDGRRCGPEAVLCAPGCGREVPRGPGDAGRVLLRRGRGHALPRPAGGALRGGAGGAIRGRPGLPDARRRELSPGAARLAERWRGAARHAGLPLGRLGGLPPPRGDRRLLPGEPGLLRGGGHLCRAPRGGEEGPGQRRPQLHGRALPGLQGHPGPPGWAPDRLGAGGLPEPAGRGGGPPAPALRRPGQGAGQGGARPGALPGHDRGALAPAVAEMSRKVPSFLHLAMRCLGWTTTAT